MCTPCLPQPQLQHSGILLELSVQCSTFLPPCREEGEKRQLQCMCFFSPKPGWGNCLYISQCNLKKRYHTCRLSGCDSQIRTRLSYRYTVEEVLQKRSMKQCTCTLYSALNTFVYVPWSTLRNTYHAFLVSGIDRGTEAHQLTDDYVLTIETSYVKGCVTI